MSLVHAFLAPLWLALLLSLGGSFLAFWLRWPRFLQPCLTGLSLALAYHLGWAQIQQQSWPPWPPINSSHWMIWLLWPICLLALVAEALPRWRWLSAGLQAMLSLSLIWLMSAPLREHSWDADTSRLILGACVLVWLMLIGIQAWLLCVNTSDLGTSSGLGSVESPAERPQVQNLLLWGWGLLGLASGGFFLLASSALLAQLALLSAAALSGSLLFAAAGGRWARTSGNFSSLSLCVYLLPALWLQLLLFTEAQPVGYLALLAPLFAAALSLRCNKQLPWQQLIICVLLNGVWLLGVALLTWWQSPAPSFYLG